MAATQYQVFCRYYNAKSNHAVLNNQQVKWTPWEARSNKRIDDAAEQITYDTEGNPNGTFQNLFIRPGDSLYQDTSGNKKEEAVRLDTRLQQVLVNANAMTNPKYDMLFTYAGVGTYTGEAKRNQTQNEVTMEPVVYYERMQRLTVTPWFLYATLMSLEAAMEKGEELVRIMGTGNVLIGKVVALDQYIDIV